MKTKTLQQSVVFTATPHELYEALMDSKKHTQFTGEKATIGRHVGDPFSTWDDWATGVNVELVPDKKIVQQWRGADWPEGHHSVITLEFKKEANGTRLDFTQTDIPESLYEDVAEGWQDWYWEKLQAYFTTEK
jgi:activator of HSP90 ATPase